MKLGKKEAIAKRTVSISSLQNEEIKNPIDNYLKQVIIISPVNMNSLTQISFYQKIFLQGLLKL